MVLKNIDLEPRSRANNHLRRPLHSALRLRLKAPHVLFPRPHPHKTPTAMSPCGLISSVFMVFCEVLYSVLRSKNC